MSNWSDALHDIVGRTGESLTLVQMLLRGLGVFSVGLVLFRLAAPRVFSRATPVDIVLAVVIGSNLSRTLTGNAPFIETLAVTALLVLLHSLLAKLATRFRPLATLLKGKPHTLAKDGEIDWSAMRNFGVGRRDLLAAVRQAGGSALDDIGLAMLERGGDIEVVLADKSAESRDDPETDCR